MFQYKQIGLPGDRSYKYLLYQQDEQLRFSDFLHLLQKGKAFRSFFIELLGGIPFRAWQWETPPVTRSEVDQPFEFVVTDSPDIDLPPDPHPFQRYFNKLDKGETVAVFDNLGGDAKLIAPMPSPNDSNLNYSHVGVFTKYAPKKEQHALWQKAGAITEKQLSGRPTWLNTAGGGVAWLHIRLDSRPKYYRHQPYANTSNG